MGVNCVWGASTVRRYVRLVWSCATVKLRIDNMSSDGGQVSSDLDVEPINREFADSDHPHQQRIGSTLRWFVLVSWEGAAFIGRRIWLSGPKTLKEWRRVLLLNLLAFVVAIVSGIITFESSLQDLRDKLGTTVLFPIYFPHAVAVAASTKFGISVFVGNLFGFYTSRIYFAWRGNYFISVMRTTVLFVVAFLGAAEVSTVAHFLRLCLRRGGQKSPSMETVRDALLFVLTVLLSTLIFETFIALAICSSPLVPWHEVYRSWGTSWMGALAGMLSVTPAAMHLSVWKLRSSMLDPWKFCEAIVILVATGASMGIIFFSDLQAIIHPLPYLLFPIIIFSAFRFNRLGSAVVVMTMSYITSWTTIRGKGALYRMAGSPTPLSSPALILQVELFVSVLGLVGILLAAAVREKKQLARELHTMNEQLENTVIQRTQELVKANDELTVSQKKAEEASQAKSDFLANMSHEIRTPIHGIMGLTALLLDSELSGDQRESLLSVKECANLLLHIINSILDLSKIEAGRVEVEFVPFNVRQLVSSTVRMLTSRSKERNLDLLWQVDSSVPEWMVGDFGKIQQCLLNLVGNAVKFTHEGSVAVLVTVDHRFGKKQHASPKQDLDLENHTGDVCSRSTSNTSSVHDDNMDSTVINVFERPLEWQVYSEEKSRWKFRNGMAFEKELFSCIPLLFEVRDTGIGISKEKLRDIFTPFTQADASTSRLYGGTGLGLCIVRRFVELLGGELLADSELGKGSAFRFCIPLRSSNGQKGVSNGKDLKSGLDLPISPQLSPDNAGETLKSGVQEKDSAHLNHTTVQDLVSMEQEGISGGDHFPVEPNSNNSEESLKILGDVQVDAPISWTPLQTMRTMDTWDSAIRDWKEFAKEEPRRDECCPEPEPLRKGQGNGSLQSNEGKEPTLKQPDMVQSPCLVEDALPISNVTVQIDDSRIITNDGQRHGVWKPVVVSSVVGLPSVPSDNQGQYSWESGPRFEGSAQDVSQKRTGNNMSVADDRRKMNLPLHVLLAEDNLINQKVATRQLQKYGHTVMVVGDGLHAVDAIRTQHDSFDLVLMDVQMPMMDGLEATRRIRSEEDQHGWSRVPILGLTAHAMQGYEVTCLSCGMDGYLGKPFDINQLLGAMDKYLHSGRRI